MPGKALYLPMSAYQLAVKGSREDQDIFFWSVSNLLNHIISTVACKVVVPAASGPTLP